MIPSLQNLIDQFRHLPSIGQKTAVRLAFSVLEFSDEEIEAFTHAITEAKRNIRYCRICQSISENELCEVCADPSRDAGLICVTEDYKSVMALEGVKEYRGVYHVLHGALSPIDGVGPEQLRLAELIERVETGTVREIILATNPTIEGEATAMYVTKLLAPYPVHVTRLAYGMSVGTDLEYADAGTLWRAIKGRRSMESDSSTEN